MVLLDSRKEELVDQIEPYLLSWFSSFNSDEKSKVNFAGVKEYGLLK